MPLCYANHTGLDATQSRCLYNVRQAFHTMQADLDPLLKGACCLPACLKAAAGTSNALAAPALQTALQAPGARSQELLETYPMTASWFCQCGSLVCS